MSIFEDIFRREWDAISDVEDVFSDDEDDDEYELSRGNLRRLLRNHGVYGWKNAMPNVSRGDMRRAERKVNDIVKENRRGHDRSDS